jgi:hypothetical protein
MKRYENEGGNLSLIDKVYTNFILRDLLHLSSGLILVLIFLYSVLTYPQFLLIED